MTSDEFEYLAVPIKPKVSCMVRVSTVPTPQGIAVLISKTAAVVDVSEGGPSPVEAVAVIQAAPLTSRVSVTFFCRLSPPEMLATLVTSTT